MPRKKKSQQNRSSSSDVVVRAHRRAEPDYRRLARALIEIAIAEIEAEKLAAAKGSKSDSTGEASGAAA